MTNNTSIEMMDEEAMIFTKLYESSPRYLPIQYLKGFVMQLPSPLGPRGYFEGVSTARAYIDIAIWFLLCVINQMAVSYPLHIMHYHGLLANVSSMRMLIATT